MSLFFVDIGCVLLSRSDSDSPGGWPAYGIALRKMERVSLQRAYSPKAWLAMQQVCEGRNTYRRLVYSALACFTAGGSCHNPWLPDSRKLTKIHREEVEMVRLCQIVSSIWHKGNIHAPVTSHLYSLHQPALEPRARRRGCPHSPPRTRRWSVGGGQCVCGRWDFLRD